MSDELVPQPPQLRISDADREKVAERLRGALGEGRLTLEEFDERLTGVLAARTFAEVEPFVSDLPGGQAAPPALEHAELRTTASTLKRRGRWVVARQLQVTAKAGSVILDFTDAVIAHRVVEIDLNVYAGSTTLIVPPGASVDVDSVELIAGQTRVRGVPNVPFAGPELHFVVRGKQRAGSLIVRQQRHFWRWRW